MFERGGVSWRDREEKISHVLKCLDLEEMRFCYETYGAVGKKKAFT